LKRGRGCKMHQVRHFSLFNASATYTSMFGTRISRTRVVSEGDTLCANGRHLQSGKSLRRAIDTVSRDASFGVYLLDTLHTHAAEDPWEEILGRDIPLVT
jgi:hypothetical protein